MLKGDDIHVSYGHVEIVCVGVCVCVFGTRFPRACSLLMDAVVNFGCTAASSQVITKHHSITNEGSLPGNVHVKK